MLYKRISATETAEELRELQVELIDRFGLLPPATKNLVRIAGIKQDANAIGIEKIDAADGGGYILFGDNSTIDPVELVKIVQNGADSYRLQGSHRLSFRLDLTGLETRFRAIEDLLERLAVKPGSRQAS
jgi:transcription-repair coupling factor (superfamily II helicase)